MKNDFLDSFKTICRLAKNDIRAKYANSLFGVFWAFTLPLVTILVFWYVFQMGFKNLPVGDAPYILWFSVAYIPWIYFTDVLVSGCGCLLEYSYLVKKIKFNVSSIPVIKMISALLIHTFFVFFLFCMAIIYRFPLTVYSIQVLYYSFAVSVFALALSYLLSALTVFFKDVVSIVNVVVQIGFWITPIIWNEKTMVDDHVRTILRLNPMHYIISGYRDAIIDRQWLWERGNEGLYFWIVTIIIFAAGVFTFKKLKPFFADEV